MSIEIVARLSANNYDDVSAVTDKLARAVEKRFDTPTMIEADYPTWSVLVKNPGSAAELRKMEEWAKDWLFDLASKKKSSTRHHTTKKSPAQLQREIDEALSRSGKSRRHHRTSHLSHPTSTGQGVDKFWDIFEEELTKSISEKPGDYALRADELQEVYARRVRDKFQQTAEEKGIRQIGLDTNTFKRVAKRLGVAKFSQGRLKDAYVALGGK